MQYLIWYFSHDVSGHEVILDRWMQMEELGHYIYEYFTNNNWEHIIHFISNQSIQYTIIIVHCCIPPTLLLIMLSNRKEIESRNKEYFGYTNRAA